MKTKLIAFFFFPLMILLNASSCGETYSNEWKGETHERVYPVNSWPPTDPAADGYIYNPEAGGWYKP